MNITDLDHWTLAVIIEGLTNLGLPTLTQGPVADLRQVYDNWAYATPQERRETYKYVAECLHKTPVEGPAALAVDAAIDLLGKYHQ